MPKNEEYQNPEENQIGRIVITDKRTQEEKSENPIDLEILKKEPDLMSEQKETERKPEGLDVIKNQTAEKEIVLTEEQKKIVKELVYELRYNKVDTALDTINNKAGLILSNEIVRSSEIKESIKKGIIDRLLRGNIQDVLKIINNKEKFFLSAEEIQEAEKEAIVDMLNRGCSDEFIKISDKFPFPNEVLSSSEVRQKTVTNILNLLTTSMNSSPIYYQFTDRAVGLIKKFKENNIAIEEDPDIVEIAKKTLLMRLRGVYKEKDSIDSREVPCFYSADDVIKIKRNFTTSDQFQLSEEYRNALRGYITNLMNMNGDDHLLIQETLKVASEFNFSSVNNDQYIKETAKKFFAAKVIKKDLQNAKQFLYAFNISEDNVSDIILREIGYTVEDIYGSYHLEEGKKRLNDIRQTFIESTDAINQALKTCIIEKISYGNITKTIQIKDDLKLDEELFTEIDKNTANNLQTTNLIQFIPYLNNEEDLNLLPNTFSKAREMIFDNLGKDSELTESFIENIGENYEQPEMIKKILIKLLEEKDAWNVVKIVNAYLDDNSSLSKAVISDPKIQKIASDFVINDMLDYLTNRLFAFIDDYNPNEIKSTFSIAGKLGLPQDIFSQPLIHNEAQKAFIKSLLYTSDEADAVRDCIRENFKITVSPQEILSNQIIISEKPEIEPLLLKLKEISPEFYNQALKSTDILISIFPLVKDPELTIETIRNNPFLAETVKENPRFGSKLLVKYPELDETSKENINFQFKAKKEILKESPDIDPESNEFRIAMQEKLKTYKNNEEILLQIECLGIRNDLIEELAEKAEKEILEENPGIDMQSNDYRVALRGKIKKYKKNKDVLKDTEFTGVDTDQWLNYSETEYFSLDSGNSKLAFSETVATPINRIKETIASYSYRVKEVIKEYQKELKEFKIQAGNVDETSKLIKKMENELSKAKTEGNEKKINGIEEGILNLKEKMKKGKEIPLWDKVIGDINAFDRLKNDVFQSHENVIKAEEKFKECAQDKSRAAMDIMETKRVLSKAKEDLKEKFGLLEQRIEDFRNNIVSILEPALGKDRAESLLQEIQQGLGEQFDHYNSDRSVLANLFSERSDKEKEKLDSRPMSIFVWARNPDIDLYQGNYSDCCIKINSEHMGAESTIADYNTDLGIQIVNIWDETKNEPITAAWCWIGEDSDGNAALVVDNIESNTLYSSNYSEQLTDKLFAYLKKYAKSIGIKKIVQGKANNDLPVASQLAKMDSDDKEYTKVGGYNRYNGEDEEGGYFLEAEGASVKTIWEEKAKKREKREKRETAKAEFGNREFRTLAEEDLADILKLEEAVYGDDNLNQGKDLIEDIETGKGFDYSVVLTGEKEAGKKEVIGYAIGVEDETDEGKPCIYLEDIVIAPEAQGQGLGWEIMRKMIEKIKEKAAKENKSILFDMHLRDSSQRLMEKHKEDLERLGLVLVDEALVPDYYSDGNDSLHQVYEVNG